MSASDDVRLITTTTHGRILVREASAGAVKGVLVGFHGYGEGAAIQMERLLGVPGSSQCTLVSVQALHRFYKGRTEDVVASWMTRQDRETAIADNVAYVDAALDSLHLPEGTRIVYAGFSQGVAMAFRAAVKGRVHAAGVIAIGGDVPPELLRDETLRFPPVLQARGERDDWYTQPKLDADLAALRGRGVAVTPLVFEGAHEWNGAASAAAGGFLGTLLGAQSDDRIEAGGLTGG
jgi:predicted esterase